MSIQSGFFRFTNFTGSTITKGWAKHWTTDWGTDGPIDLANLPQGASTIKIPFKTSTSNKDRWAFSVETKDGSKWSCDEHNCGFEDEDQGGTVTLSCNVAKSNATFHIKMPESSGCDTSADSKYIDNVAEGSGASVADYCKVEPGIVLIAEGIQKIVDASLTGPAKIGVDTAFGILEAALSAPCNNSESAATPCEEKRYSSMKTR
jgi:hypothetical protein